MDVEKADPENRLYARMHRSRLDFEAQRDAVPPFGRLLVLR